MELWMIILISDAILDGGGDDHDWDDMNLSSIGSSPSKIHHLSPIILRKSSTATFSTLGAISLLDEEDDNDNDQDFESPTLVTSRIKIGTRIIMSESGDHNSNGIPPPRAFDEFQTLSSTKQNIELFKILSAIAEEIEGKRPIYYIF